MLPKPHDNHLFEPLELSIGETPDGEVGKVVAQDPADIRRQPVVRHDVEQQPSIDQMAHTFYEKALFMAGPPTTGIEYRQIGRVEKQQMEGFVADAAVKEAAEAHPVQPTLGLLGPVLIQLHTVGEAVVALGQLPKGLAAAAAGVQQIGGDTLGKLDALQHGGNVVRVSRVVAHLYMVHETADDGGVGFAAHGKSVRKAAESVKYRLVGGAHQIEAQQSRLQLPGSQSQPGFLQLQKQELGGADGFGQGLPDFLQFCIGVPCGSLILLPGLLHSGPLDDQGLGQPENFRLQG